MLRIFGRPRRVSEPRQRRVRAFEKAHSLEELEFFRPRAQRRLQY